MALEAGHALVDQHRGDAALVSDGSPHGRLPQIGALRVLRNEVPARVHLGERCDACQLRERDRHPSRSHPTRMVYDAVECAEALHTRARNAYDQDGRLALA